MSTKQEFTISPLKDITFQDDKNGDSMAWVQFQEPMSIDDDFATRFSAHSKWTAKDYQILKELVESETSDDVVLEVSLTKKGSYFNLVKGSLSKI